MKLLAVATIALSIPLIGPLCVNPDHLEAVTPQENRKRQRESITHCKYGHALEGDNLYVDSRGHRACKACGRRLSREAYWRRRAA